MTTTGPFVLEADWPEYTLLDCGGGRKLEKFGEFLVDRPEPKAWWKPALPSSSWKDAMGRFEESGKWRMRGKQAGRKGSMRFHGLTLETRLTDMSKHIGVFPEQEPHWSWIFPRLQKMERPRVLNLFGYTGVASLVSALAGAEVTHVDASKPAMTWARQNQTLSNLESAPVRWILDDAFKFVAREIRRKRVYEAILLDPPSFGRGPKGEVWKVEDQIVELLQNLRMLLNPQRGILLLTMYNLEASSLMLANLIEDLLPPGALEFGELSLLCNSGKRLPLSLFARWESEL